MTAAEKAFKEWEKLDLRTPKQYCSKTASPMNEIAAKEYVCNRYEAREKL